MSEILMNNQVIGLENNFTFLNSSPSSPADSAVNSDELLKINGEINRLYEETMDNGIISVNEGGIILSFNEKAREIFGYLATDAIGKNIGDIILLEYPDKLDSCIVNFIKRQGKVKFLDRLCEISENYGNDSIIPVKFSIGKTHLDDRLLVSITVQHAKHQKLSINHEKQLISKLTEMDQLLVNKRAELDVYKGLIRKEMHKRKQTEDKLRLSQAMSSIDARFIKAGRVAEQIAHDFNNLLVPLQAFPKLLKSKLQDDCEGLDYCRTMEKTAHRLMQINDRLLALMTFNRQETVPFDVNLVLQETTNLVGDYLKDDLAITASIPSERYMVNGRPEQLYRVFFNLLLNAKDAINGSGGNIDVKSEKVVLASTHAHQELHVGNEYAKITIGDTGRGIPPENLTQIFDPFYTTKNGTRQVGSGLGLAIVKDIVTDHGGAVDADSKIGQGSVFSVHLPVTSG